MPAPPGWHRFGTLSTIDGIDVIDEATGRPVDHRATLSAANGRAQHLNRCAAAGSAELVLALNGGRRNRTTMKVTPPSTFGTGSGTTLT